MVFEIGKIYLMADGYEARVLQKNFQECKMVAYDESLNRRTLHGQIAHEIPKGWRICGENMFAR
jgi:hypothetical protein